MQRRKPVPTELEPLQVIFDPTPEIFATDAGGSFVYDLEASGHGSVLTAPYDEMRVLVSLWHPGSGRVIDLDRAYVELRASLDPADEHWTQLAEIEPVVPAYNAGDCFDGWIVLPVMAKESAFCLVGRGFQPRSRIQIRASAYLVS